MQESSNTRVAVLIRVHGDQPYLSSAINSVREQVTDFKFDIYLILDRPSEALKREIDSSLSSGVSLFEPKSKGLAGPLSEILLELGVEYISILDSDDLMMAGRLQKQFNFLESNQGIAVVGTGIIFIDESGIEFGRKLYSSDSNSIRTNRYISVPVAHPSVMFRRSVIIDVGSYRNFYNYAEDVDLWLRVLEMADICNLPDYLTKYRIHYNQTVSTQQVRNVITGILARKSAIRREKGLQDYSELFLDIEELSKRLSIRVEAAWRILRLRLWSSFMETLRRKRKFKIIFLVFPILLVDPRGLFRKVLARRK